MKYNFVIVSMFKNESMIMDEWITHHLQYGVDHFYLINNGSTDNSQDILSKYSQYITLISDSSQIFSHQPKLVQICNNDKKYINIQRNVTFQQYMINKYFLKNVKENANWVAVIDCDEYIYSPKGDNIGKILTNIKPNITRLFIPWKRFGSNHLIQQPKSIREGFTLRMKFQPNKPNFMGYGKSIEKVNEIRFMCPHESDLIHNYSILPNLTNLNHDNFIKYQFSDNDILCCNHYATMSREYFDKFKSKRTGASTNIIRGTSNYWKTNDNQLDDENDVTLCKLVTK